MIIFALISVLIAICMLGYLGRLAWREDPELFLGVLRTLAIGSVLAVGGFSAGYLLAVVF